MDQLLNELTRRGWKPPISPLMEAETQALIDELKKRFDGGMILAAAKIVSADGRQNLTVVVYPAPEPPKEGEVAAREPVQMAMYLHAVLAGRIFAFVPRNFKEGLDERV